LTTSDENAGFLRFWVKMLPVTLTNIPLFFINSEWLIPQVFRKKGLGWYLLSVAAVAALFIVFQGILSAYIRQCHFHFEFRYTFPIYFVLAISTAYSLIDYMASQDKIRALEQRERLQSELSFLRSQISPHFIFNILNSIVYLIRSKNEAAEAVTIKLSELMRYMLYESSGEQIALEKEICYLKNYIELQNIRFGEDVAVHFSEQGDSGGKLIEPMLMIPFVENAFKHGVGMIAEPHIGITVKTSENSLDFTVSNKFSEASQETKDGNSGIGLRNVKRRLELLYPQTHQLNITQKDSNFTVHLHLIFHPEV
jgi:sensor histidine kinase YesM